MSTYVAGDFGVFEGMVESDCLDGLHMPEGLSNKCNYVRAEFLKNS